MTEQTIFTFRIIKQDTCRTIYHEVDQKLKITESNLCAISSIGDSCRGDSGGGLIVQKKSRRLDFTIYMRFIIPLLRYYEIVGVVSYGVGCNSTINGEIIIVYGLVECFFLTKNPKFLVFTVG